MGKFANAITVNENSAINICIPCVDFICTRGQLTSTGQMAATLTEIYSLFSSFKSRPLISAKQNKIVILNENFSVFFSNSKNFSFFLAGGCLHIS